jgi:hypothetical protein
MSTEMGERLIDRMEALGRQGFTVSVCCGPSESDLFQWSIQVLSPHNEAFERPYLAQSFAHAITIAEVEITRRGWA